MKFYQTALAVVFAAAVSMPLHAQTPVSDVPSKASLEALFAVQDFDKILDESFKRVPGLAAESMPDIPADRRAEFNKVLEKYFGLMDREINTPEMRHEIRNTAIRAAAEIYTQAEVDALLRFYQSPEGRSAMSKTPRYIEAVMAPTAGIMQPKMQAFLQKYGAQMRRELNQAVCGKNNCAKAAQPKK
ncbi:DUF2059 domain-containing protein [Bergeriella denitrificans]|uniref:Periplasmic protein n=1 Tax=Bergeriella denitrificans TaxID=494 RepID=A0A378UGF6_BERDE|nr:DUF2059 domain-containing protein [Bergeriella denitrificans]STZ76385.1 Periplasmic protein [Bergeriella denitrificans]